MTASSASQALDGQALALLGRLLDTAAPEREAQLEDLQHTDPALHARVMRLLRASQDSAASIGMAAPVAAAWRAMAEHQAGDSIAGYRLLRELGRGGMSVVWLAERDAGDFRRQVALKLPISPQVAGGVLAERFARERDVLSALDHPHVARLFDAGVAADGQPYIVLEAVSGQTLTAYADGHGLGMRERLALFLQVLAAVEHAHAHMVVHRDLKPSNILVNDKGQVKLLDFGIAKLMAQPGGNADLTGDAGAVLTPRYAAPEQVLGLPVTAATDVYAAGVVLYELLTGHLPFAADEHAVAQVLQAVTQDEPIPPGLSTDVDTVLLKALRKAPADRYASAERFAEDLRRLLADQPILARRVPAWQRGRLLLRRHRLAGAVLAGGSVVLAITGSAAWQQARETAAQRQRADAVQVFVYSMIADAEPAEGHSDVTGREMLDAAVARARTELADDPRLRGELLGELGRVYFRLQRPTESVATLEESLALLTATAETNDAALNRTRAALARSLIATDADRATRLAEQALADCGQAGHFCSEARAYARYALAAITSWRGEHAASLAHARAMVQELTAAFGPDDASLAPALETVAGAALNQGELQEAAAAVERAQELARQYPLKAANRDRLDLMQASVQIELGEFAAARDGLAALMTRPSGDAERAAQRRSLAWAEIGLGRPAAALRVAESGLPPSSPELPTASGGLTQLVWGVAASLDGHHAQGLRAIDTAAAALAAAGFEPDSGTLRRLQRRRAEVLLRQGHARTALAELRRLAAESRSDLPRDRAELLDALGCAEVLASGPDAASASWAEAAALRATRLPATHPLRLRNAVLRATLRGGSALQQALPPYRATLAADSPWQQREISDCRAVL